MRFHLKCPRCAATVGVDHIEGGATIECDSCRLQIRVSHELADRLHHRRHFTPTGLADAGIDASPIISLWPIILMVALSITLIGCTAMPWAFAGGDLESDTTEKVKVGEFRSVHGGVIPILMSTKQTYRGIQLGAGQVSAGLAILGFLFACAAIEGRRIKLMSAVTLSISLLVCVILRLTIRHNDIILQGLPQYYDREVSNRLFGGVNAHTAWGVYAACIVAGLQAAAVCLSLLAWNAYRVRHQNQTVDTQSS